MKTDSMTRSTTRYEGKVMVKRFLYLIWDPTKVLEYQKTPPYEGFLILIIFQHKGSVTKLSSLYDVHVSGDGYNVLRQANSKSPMLVKLVPLHAQIYIYEYPMSMLPTLCPAFTLCQSKPVWCSSWEWTLIEWLHIWLYQRMRGSPLTSHSR